MCRIVPIIVLICTLGVWGCSGPHQRMNDFFSKAKVLYDHGDYAGSRRELEKALQIDPRFVRGRLLLGMVELKVGNPLAAYAAFAGAAEVEPANAETQVQLGKLLLFRGEVEKARARAETVLRAQPQHEEALLLQAGVHLVSGQWQQGERTLLATAQRGARRPELFLLLSMARRLRGDAPGAEEALLNGLSLNKSSLELHKALAELYAGKGGTTAAERQIREMMALDPANHGYLIALADLHWRSGAKQKARAELTALISRSACNVTTITDAARFYQQHGLPADAEQLLVQAIGRNGRSIALRLSLCELYLVGGTPLKAVASLRRCMDVPRERGNAELLAAKNALAALEMGRGELAEAGRLSDEVLRENPSDADANMTRGHLFLLRGEAPKAVAAFLTAVRDCPASLQPRLLLAEAYAASGDSGLALTTLHQARHLDPCSTAVALALTRHYLARHDYAMAEEELRGMLAGKPRLLDELRAVLLPSGASCRSATYCNAIRAMAPAMLPTTSKAGDLNAVSGGELAGEVGEGDDALFRRLVLLYLRQKKFSVAAADCRARIARMPGDPGAHLLLARVLEEQGAFAQAEAALERAERLVPCPLQVSLARARLKVKEGEHHKARRLYEAILAKERHSLAAANDLACLLADFGGGRHDLLRALYLAEELLASRPDEPLFFDTLGWVHYRRGEYRRAASLLQQAAARLPHSPVVRYHAGMALWAAGAPALAREHLLYAARSPAVFAGNKEAQEALSRLK